MIPLLTAAAEILNKLIKPTSEKVRQSIANWLPDAAARQALRKQKYDETPPTPSSPSDSK